MITSMILPLAVVAVTLIHSSSAQRVQQFQIPSQNFQGYGNLNSEPVGQPQGMTSQNYVGLPYLPMLFPNGLPILPNVHSHYPHRGTKLVPAPAFPGLLLNPNQQVQEGVPIQQRSTVTEEKIKKKEYMKPKPEKIKNIEYAESKAETIESKNSPINLENTEVKTSIDPMEQFIDGEQKLVIGSSPDSSDLFSVVNSQQPKVRSPDDNGSLDELDYLTKAANPVDDLGHQVKSMIKKVGQGIKHTYENAKDKIESVLKSEHKSTAKEADFAPESEPRDHWAKSPRVYYDNKEKQNTGEKPSISDIMGDYLKMMNTGQNSKDSTGLEGRLAPGLKTAMDDFQKSLSKSLLLQESIARNSNSESNSEGGPGSFMNTPRMGKDQESNKDITSSGYSSNGKTQSTLGKESKSSNNLSSMDKSSAPSLGTKDSTLGKPLLPALNPLEKIINSASGSALNLAGTLLKPNLLEVGKSLLDPKLLQNSKLIEQVTDLASNILDLPSNSKDPVPNERTFGGNYGGGYYPEHYPSYPYYGHRPMYPPHYPHGGYPPSFNHGGHYYKRDSPIEIRSQRQIPFLSQGGGQYAGGITNSALGLTEGILSGRPDQITNAGVSMGTGIYGSQYGAPQYYKRSYPSETQDFTVLRNQRQTPFLSQDGGQYAEGVTNSAFGLVQGILSGRPDQIASSSVNMGTGIYGAQSYPPQYFKRSYPSQMYDFTILRNQRQVPFLTKQEAKSAGKLTDSAGKVTNSAFGLAHGILNDRPDQIAHSGIRMGTGIYKTQTDASQILNNNPPSILRGLTVLRNQRQIPFPFLSQGRVQYAGGVTNSALGLTQGILSGRPDQIANSGVNMGTGIYDSQYGASLYSKRSYPLEANDSTTSISQGQSTGGVGKAAMSLAEGILSNKPTQIARAGVNIGTGLLGLETSSSNYSKRSSPDENPRHTLDGLTGSVAKLALNPGQGGEVIGSVGSVWNAANNLLSDIGSVAVGSDNIGGDRLLGSTQTGEYDKNLTPFIQIWGSATDLLRKLANSADFNRLAVDRLVGNSLFGQTDDLGKSMFNSADFKSDNSKNDEIVGAPKPPTGNFDGRITATEFFEAANELATGVLKYLLNTRDALNSRQGNISPSDNMSESLSTVQNIVNAATDSNTSNGDEQILQSFGPTYAGGYFPRSAKPTLTTNVGLKVPSGIAVTPLVLQTYFK